MTKKKKNEPYKSSTKCLVCDKEITTTWKYSPMLHYYVDAESSPVESLHTKFGVFCSVAHMRLFKEKNKDD